MGCHPRTSLHKMWSTSQGSIHWQVFISLLFCLFGGFFMFHILSSLSQEGNSYDLSAHTPVHGTEHVPGWHAGFAPLLPHSFICAWGSPHPAAQVPAQENTCPQPTAAGGGVVPGSDGFSSLSALPSCLRQGAGQTCVRLQRPLKCEKKINRLHKSAPGQARLAGCRGAGGPARSLAGSLSPLLPLSCAPPDEPMEKLWEPTVHKALCISYLILTTTLWEGHFHLHFHRRVNGGSGKLNDWPQVTQIEIQVSLQSCTWVWTLSKKLCHLHTLFSAVKCSALLQLPSPLLSGPLGLQRCHPHHTALPEQSLPTTNTVWAPVSWAPLTLEITHWAPWDRLVFGQEMVD